MRLLSPAPRTLARRTRPVTVIAHRGASGCRPEHTLAAYRLAIEQGADVIEPDVVSTRDGVLVARHENEIGGTTDVASRPEFAARRTTKVVGTRQATGWFTEDFTLAELKTLRAVERMPMVRPGNTTYDGAFEVPTLDEVIDLARSEGRRRRRRIGVAPETKHAAHFAGLGLDPVAPLLRSLRRVGWDSADAPVVVQSFETQHLRALAEQCRAPLMQLTRSTDDHLLSPSGLRHVGRYAQWLGAAKDSVIPRDASGRLTIPTELVADARRAGLLVAAYTFRDENRYLPADLRSSAATGERGDGRAELGAFFAAGIDAAFVDFPDTGSAAREAFSRS